MDNPYWVYADGRDILTESTDNYLTFSYAFTIPTTETIMPDGGVLQSELDQVSYAIPSGTFTNTVTVTHMAIFQDIPPTNRIPIGRAFEITAVFSDTGQTAVLQKPISVTVPYNPSRVGHLIDGTMALYYWDGAAWQKSDTSIINPQTNIITATLPYQTIWQLQGETNRIYMPIMPYKQK